jgi:hypothetical protein
MSNYPLQSFVAVGLFLGSTSIAPAVVNSEAIALNQQVMEVATLLEGVMDTSLQAKANPKRANVQMTTCRVQLVNAKKQNSIFLYQEQAIVPDLNQPYRQRFLEILPHPLSQTVRSLAYKPTNPSALINFCDRPTAKRKVLLQEIGNPICSVFLKRSGSAYVGVTPTDGCPANVRGAVRITNRIVLQQTGMDTWDRGFDASGKQVWGAQRDSYQFRRKP